jgi:hypothetical protein
MPESELRWSEVKKKAEKPLQRLLKKIMARASTFGPVPEDPLEREQFEIRLTETATEWALSAIEIYLAALTKTGCARTAHSLRQVWRNGLHGFLLHRIMPQVEVAVGFNEEDRNSLDFERLISTPQGRTAAAKRDSLSHIFTQLCERTKAQNFWTREEVLSVESGLVEGVAGGQVAETNRGRVDGFIRKMSAPGHKVTRKDIWTVAGYKVRSELWRFETGKRCTAAARISFNRVLSLAPEEFARELRVKSGSK